MADHNGFLFVNEEGAPLVFYMRPSEEKARLKPIIEGGGGKLTNKEIDGAVRLIKAGDVVISGAVYHLSRYIDDCVQSNVLLPLEDYKVTRSGVVHKKKPIKHSTGDDVSADDDVPAYIVQNVAKGKTSRREYLLSEDINMIKYICEEREHARTKGNELWKKMEKLPVVQRSWQSMKDRFHKHVLPNIQGYNIKPSWISLLTYREIGIASNDDDDDIDDNNEGNEDNKGNDKTDVVNDSNCAINSEADNESKNDELDEKLLVIAESDIAGTNSADSTSPTKRKRGRPKKKKVPTATLR